MHSLRNDIVHYGGDPNSTGRYIEVIIDTEDYVPQLDQILRDYCQEMPLELVKIRINRPYKELAHALTEVPDLEDLEVEEVFRKKCLSEGELAQEKLEELVLTFRELQNWMAEQEA